MPSRKDPELTTLHTLMPYLHESNSVQSSVRAHQRIEGETFHPMKREKALAAHVLRLQRTFESDSDTLRERTWEAAVNALVIEPDDIPESYWRSQERIARNNGQSDNVLDSHQKAILAKQIRDAQYASAKDWAEYLEEIKNFYPTWFKIYAWDGMSRMGLFDKNQSRYRRRDKSTVAPYPQLDALALDNVYEILNAHFTGNNPPNGEELAELTRCGNFNSLYSRCLLGEHLVVETPENPEDVRGAWVEYTQGDIEALAQAAKGTGWCIDKRKTAEDYVGNGDTFHLFHLFDDETGLQSDTACASIRLDSDGRVAEISGLANYRSGNDSDQLLEDALVPAVLEKVKTMPGGEQYLQAFKDQQKLIAMDKKFARDESFDLEEIEFLYETERKIARIGIQGIDPRPNQFRHYDRPAQRRTLESKYSALEVSVLMDMEPDKVEANLDYLLNHHTTNHPRLIALQLPLHSIVKNFTRLSEAGVKLDLATLRGNFSPEDIVDVAPGLTAAGLAIDINSCMQELEPHDIVYRLDKLLEAGADIDLDDLVNRLDYFDIANNLTDLLKAGAVIDGTSLINELTPRALELSLEQFLDARVGVDTLVESLDLPILKRHLYQLLAAGANVDAVAERLDSIDDYTIRLLQAYGYTR